MSAFETKRLGIRRDDVAPDGSDVRVLLRLKAGSMAHFQLAGGKTSYAVRSLNLEEIWFFISGRGEMWRKQDRHKGQTVQVKAGVSLTIPRRTSFQFRSFGPEPLSAVAVTMPPWSDESKVVTVEGKWTP